MVLAVNAAINRQAVKQGFWLKVVVNRLAEQVVQSGYSLKIAANRLAVQLSSYSLTAVELLIESRGQSSTVQLSSYSLKVVVNRLAVQVSSYSLKVVVNCLAV